MSTFHTVIGFGAFGCAALVAVANWSGVIASSKRTEGTAGGYSCIPLVSLICGVIAWFTIRNKIGLWSFAPAAIDLGTLSFVALPVILLVGAVRRKIHPNQPDQTSAPTAPRGRGSP